MKKKTVPKPTKVSKHHAPYVFQSQSANLHPLATKPQNVTPYQPQTSVVNHVSTNPSATWHSNNAVHVAESDHFRTVVTPPQSDDGFSFKSSNNFEFTDGLSTDGFEVYDARNQLAQQSFYDDGNDANRFREQNVRSAPAAFPGSHQLRPIYTNSSTIFEDDNSSQQSAHRVQILERQADDEDLTWIFNTVHTSQQRPKPVPQSAAFLKSLSKSASASGSAVDLPYENFLLRLVDKDLEQHHDFGFLDSMESEEIVETTGFEPDTGDEDGIYEDEDDDSAGENFWSKSAKGSNKRQRDAVALSRGSILALLDDSKHDTSVKHSRAAGVDFFQAAAAAAAAVGLDDMATKLTPKPSRAVSGKEFFAYSPDASRPESPVAPTVRATSSGKEQSHDTSNSPISNKRSLPADWTDAFASYEDVAFDAKKVHRSKSMEAIDPRTLSGQSNKNIKRPPELKIEDFLKDIVDVEESDNGTPFKIAAPSRRRSFAGITDFENSHHTSPKVVDKSGKVKYFSYLYKSQKKRVKSPVLSKNEDGLAMAVEQTRATNTAAVLVPDPFASNRSERRNSPPNIIRAYSSDSGDEASEPAATLGAAKPKPVVELGERRFSSPSVDGPVWGQIPNFSTKPANILSESRKNSPMVRSGTPSKPNSRAATPVIVGLIKKFSFEGEYLKSPFLHHMTKDKHLEKYGDAQRKQRQADKTSPKNANAKAKSPTAKSPKGGTAKSPKNASTPKGGQPSKRASSKMSQSAGALLESSTHTNSATFDTSVDKPRNPFLRQNSWEKDTDAIDFSSVIAQRRPFAKGGSFDRSVNSTLSDLDNSSAAKSKHSLSRQSTIELLEDSDLPEKPSFSRQGSFANSNNFPPSEFAHNSSPAKLSLSRQNSMGRDAAGKGLLSRQPSIVADRDDGRPPALSRQNSYSAAGGAPQTLPPLVGAPAATTEMQSLINSINSVLVAPTPLKHSRPADVFSKGYGSPQGNNAQNMQGEADDVNSAGLPSTLSRGNSTKNISPRQSPTTSHSPVSRGRGAGRKSISPQRAGDVAGGISLLTADNDSRPGSRQPGTNSVSFALAAPSSTPPAISETIMQYVPSERRGSLSGEGMEELMNGVSKATIMQRRKSTVGQATPPVTSNIDMLVSARRNSFIAGSPDTSRGGMGTPGFSFMENSVTSEFSNPLMEEYYDAEEGLQDTGIIIANLHADPLYRILREELERKEADGPATNTPHYIADRPVSGMVQGQHSRPQSSKPRKLPPRPTRSANGLSNYKSRILSQYISPPDLKVLSTFASLPPAAWVTCRVVYFLMLSFYETVPRIGKHYEYRTAMGMEPLWYALETQRTEYKLCMEEVELEYSWPLLQALLAKFPVLITKLLYVIEHGTGPSSGLDSSKKHASFHPDVFFDAFPPTKLIYLRDLIKQGMGLFQCAELIHMIPVAAQMCDWCKRIIAQVYASCITRLRASQSNIKKVTSVLHSTITPYASVEEILAGTSALNSSEFNTHAPVALPPNFKFVLAIEDALDEGALFAMHSQDSYSAFENSQSIFVNLSHTLEKGLNLVKPSDHLDLILVPPCLSDISAQVSMYGGTVIDEFGSLTGASLQDTTGSLLRIQSDWLITKHNYERHLQQYAASPLHRVVLVPPPRSDTSSATAGADVQQENELQKLLEDFYREQNADHRAHAQNFRDTSSKAKAPLFPLQALGVHPVVEHSLTSVALPMSPTAAAKVSTQADVLITRLRNGKLPGFVKDNLAINTGSTKAGADKR